MASGGARLSAFQAAKQRVSTNRLSRPAGIFTLSLACRDMEKSGGVQSTCRTAAMASLNVGSCLRYQIAVFGRSVVAASRAKPSAHTVIKENNPQHLSVLARVVDDLTWGMMKARS